ncbi:MAG: epoxyqueuosine reductase QueH [Deltaproteobacteria bacterium]|nr:epoxyqueuosine reductase QueH [Deltaproteobacteria bacterium]MBW1986714.1 epoxyqueuosine reductase QueH [Deltaproteobacteria bacterium]MBW2134560.1 epoxyqueuosine reductase QueH [Deltaproteobacteria bacterium]
MKILLHICCAPCALYPQQVLSAAGMGVHGYFYNPNIQPYQEFERRLKALEDYAMSSHLPLIVDRRYDLEEFLRLMVFREHQRCRICYHLRLKGTAHIARHGKFDAFTTTLLYSKQQQHELIREIGEQVGQELGVPFYYQDFRPGWKQGIEESKRLGLYRQSYCGCIYSERDRYYHPERIVSRRDAKSQRCHEEK